MLDAGLLGSDKSLDKHIWHRGFTGDNEFIKLFLLAFIQAGLHIVAQHLFDPFRRQRLRIACAFFGGISGLYLSYHFAGVPSGAGIVLCCALPYLIARLRAPRR